MNELVIHLGNTQYVLYVTMMVRIYFKDNDTFDTTLTKLRWQSYF
jgi:hypothetical protein